MEQVIPGADPEDWDSDPVLEAVELNESGDRSEAWTKLMGLAGRDLRCLDAHAHLGNWEFDTAPSRAIRHYEAGVRIGELSLGSEFAGVLPWGLVDNRPFLRCLHGYGLTLWRLGRADEAAAVFERMLWLNPSDNQGERFNLAAARTGKTWEEFENASSPGDHGSQ
jgi:tetratricopeptide (TPR) repeat protein